MVFPLFKNILHFSQSKVRHAKVSRGAEKSDSKHVLLKSWLIIIKSPWRQEEQVCFFTFCDSTTVRVNFLKQNVVFVDEGHTKMNHNKVNQSSFVNIRDFLFITFLQNQSVSSNICIGNNVLYTNREELNRLLCVVFYILSESLKSFTLLWFAFIRFCFSEPFVMLIWFLP